MPVTSKVRGFSRYRDDVAGAGGDVPGAPGTDVGLGRLVGLDASHIDLESHRVTFGGFRHGVATGSAEERPDHETGAHHEGGTDHHEVEWGATVLSMRIESHVASIAGGGRDPDHRPHG
jgi:hypothetical protein